MQSDQPIPWSGEDLLRATGGTLLAGSPGQRFAGVAIDSRRIAADEIFVAIVGEVHDGHRFCQEVVDRGVRGLVVADDHADGLPLARWRQEQITCVAVGDTTEALGALAAFNRRRSPVGVIGITGSNGKTTTRRMTAAVVSRRFNTLATIGNLNNAIGLPLTLLRLSPAHRWAVLEMGTNHPGEIAALAAICEPDIGVITNIAPAHLAGLGSLDGVMHAKGELLQHLRPKGRAVLNADDPRVLGLARACSRPVVLFGTSSEAQVRATDIRDTLEGVDFTLTVGGRQVDVGIRIPGRFMVTNALAAAAVGHTLGLGPESIRDGLAQVTAVPGRMAVIRTKLGVTIIDDAYNANPDSMRAAFDALRALCGRQRAFLVLGDMLELGPEAEEWHRRIGTAAVQTGAARIFVTGDFAATVAAAARGAAMPSASVFTGSRDEIAARLKTLLVPGDWVLVKGSRGMKLDQVVSALKEWAEAGGGKEDPQKNGR